jgi:hypothetical protein
LRQFIDLSVFLFVAGLGSLLRQSVWDVSTHSLFSMVDNTPHATSHPALAGIDVDGFTGVLLFQDFAWNQKL